MARITRATKAKSLAKTSPKATKAAEPDTPLKSVEGSNSTRTNRQKHNTVRSRQYKRKKRQRAVLALDSLAKTPLSRTERDAIRADFYRHWNRKAKKEKQSELEDTIRKQQNEIEQLKMQISDTKNPEEGAGRANGAGRGGRRARKSTA